MARDTDEDCNDDEKSLLENLRDCIGSDKSGVEER